MIPISMRIATFFWAGQGTNVCAHSTNGAITGVDVVYENVLEQTNGCRVAQRTQRATVRFCVCCRPLQSRLQVLRLVFRNHSRSRSVRRNSLIICVEYLLDQTIFFIRNVSSPHSSTEKAEGIPMVSQQGMNWAKRGLAFINPFLRQTS